MANEEVKDLAESLSHDWPLIIRSSYTENQLVELLAIEINRMIRDQFPWLIQLLYRIDISESKLRHLLANNKNTDAGKVIAHLIVERQKQKLAAKRNASSDNKNIPDEEKW